jgi:hypothetical protein
MRRKLSFGVEKLSFGATQPQEMSALGHSRRFGFVGFRDIADMNS